MIICQDSSIISFGLQNQRNKNQPVYAYIHLYRDNNDKYAEALTSDREAKIKRIHDFGHLERIKWSSPFMEGKTWPVVGEDCVNFQTMHRMSDIQYCGAWLSPQASHPCMFARGGWTNRPVQNLHEV